MILFSDIESPDGSAAYDFDNFADFTSAPVFFAEKLKTGLGKR